MKVVNDQTFGEMEYKYAWEALSSIDLWENSYPVKVVANDPDGVGITDEQREAFKAASGRFAAVVNENEEVIRSYCNDTFGVKMPVMNAVLQPRSIVFQRDGSWGFLLIAPTIRSMASLFTS